jgi:hypothetical protein
MVLCTPSDDILGFFFASMTKDWASLTANSPAGASLGDLDDEDVIGLAEPASKIAAPVKKAAPAKKKGKAPMSDDDEENEFVLGDVAPVAASSSSSSGARSPPKKPNKPKNDASGGNLLINSDSVDDTFAAEEARLRQKREDEQKQQEATRKRHIQEAEDKVAADKRKRDDEEKQREERARRLEEDRNRQKEEERKHQEEERKRQQETERKRQQAEEEERRKRIPRTFSSLDFMALGVPDAVELGSFGKLTVALNSSIAISDAELDQLKQDEKYPIQCRLIGPSGSVEGLVDVDEDDGTRNITFFPTRTGKYKANIKLGESHILGSPFDVEVTKSGVSKKRKASESAPAPSSPKRRKQDVALNGRKPTMLQYEESDDDVVAGEGTMLISPPSKPKPSVAPKQYKVQSDLEAPTLLIDDAAARVAPPSRAVSKPKMVFADDEDDDAAGDTLPMDSTSHPKQPNPVVPPKDPPAKLDDSTGLLRLESDEEDGYNTGDSDIERRPPPKNRPKSSHAEASKAPPSKKRSLIVDSDEDEAPVKFVPKSKSKTVPAAKPTNLFDEEEEIEPTLLI